MAFLLCGAARPSSSRFTNTISSIVRIERRVLLLRTSHALDRLRLRQAKRLFEARDAVGKTDLMTIETEDVLARRVLSLPVAGTGER